MQKTDARRRHAPLLALGLTFGAAPALLPLLDCPVTREVTMRACAHVSEAPHDGEHNSGEGAVRATQTAGSTASRTPLQGVVRGGPAVLRGQLSFRA